MAPGGAEQDVRPRNGQPLSVYTRNGGPYLSPRRPTAAARLPSGHPEGFFEAFANVYVAAYDDMIKRAAGQKVDDSESLYPNVATAWTG